MTVPCHGIITCGLRLGLVRTAAPAKGLGRSSIDHAEEGRGLLGAGQMLAPDTPLLLRALVVGAHALLGALVDRKPLVLHHPDPHPVSLLELVQPQRHRHIFELEEAELAVLLQLRQGRADVS